MTLVPGSKLGPFEIVAPLGAGGMGEVHRARDTRLGRDVAIKALPDAFAQDPERLARFEREARLLASLSHPNVAGIHGIEQVGTSRYLVLEFVEGETLAARLTRGPLAPDEATEVCRQVAAGVEAAHDAGVVHRDLKPGNVMLKPDGTVKVLDFGLAKAGAAHGGDSSDTSLSVSPTMTSVGTMTGVILGTAAYMSPEQARGKPVDRRTDIWSFGCVLYECLTGKRVYDGETVPDMVAKILEREPDWMLLPATTPLRVRELLRRCLAKDVRQRLQAIGEARIALERAGDPSDATVPGSRETPLPTQRPLQGKRGLHRLWPWSLAALFLVGWTATVLVLTKHPASDSRNLRTSLVLPDSVGIPTLTYNASGSLATLALSPSGDQVAFVGYRNDLGALYLRRLDSFDAVRLPNTETAAVPVFSPDGKRLAFSARGRLWRLDLPGGVPVDLGAASTLPEGASWTDDDVIVYTPNYAEAIWKIPASGGQAKALTQVNRAAGEVSHRWPCALPGSAGVLFTIKSATDETLDDARIAVADPLTGEHHVLVEGGTSPRYLDSGHLVFARAGRLYAVRFDLASLTIRGAPVPVLDGVATAPMTGAAWYDITRQGVLAYVAGGTIEPSTSFSWEGPGSAGELLRGLRARSFVSGLLLSRDFRRAVVQIGAANDKIWLVDLEQRNMSRLTSGGGNDNAGALSPDGRWLLFLSDRAGGGFHFYRMPLDGSTPPKSFLEDEGQLDTISYPARMLGLSLRSERDGWDAYVMAIAEDGMPTGKPVLVAGGPEDQAWPTVSADRALVAYQSSESGRDEVYVTHLADPGNRRRLTNDGGGKPLWNRDGSRLFYVSKDTVFSVVLRSAPELRFGDPQIVAKSKTPGVIVAYDVGPDGTSALVSRVSDPLLLRQEVRLWPDWGKRVRSATGGGK